MPRFDPTRRRVFHPRITRISGLNTLPARSRVSHREGTRPAARRSRARVRGGRRTHEASVRVPRGYAIRLSHVRPLRGRRRTSYPFNPRNPVIRGSPRWLILVIFAVNTIAVESPE